MAKEKTMPKVDYELCMACGICIMACPYSCMEPDYVPPDDEYKKPRPQLAYPDYCIGCGICSAACPVDVIEMVKAEGLEAILTREHEARKISAVEKEKQRKEAAEAFLKAMMEQAAQAQA